MLTIENQKRLIEIACRGQRLLRYHVETKASKPYFDVVALPPTAEYRAGQNVVLAVPHDHIWHFGLFFAQKYVDGMNFWESELLADRKEPHGECRHTGDLKVASHDDGTVGFSHAIDWRTSTGEVWIREQRSIVVHPPVRNHYRIDWMLVWRAAGKDRTLTSTSQYGDYSGLSYRSPRSMDADAGRALNSEGGDTIEKVHSHPARWADYSGKLDGKVDLHNPDWAGITMLDHPGNHGHPIKWFCINRPFGFLAANRTFGGSWTLPKDQPVTTRFAVIVHAGLPDRAAIEKEYQSFAQ